MDKNDPDTQETEWTYQDTAWLKKELVAVLQGERKKIKKRKKKYEEGESEVRL